MPKIDLPPDSLGPKPTKKQLDLLTQLAQPDVIVHEWSGSRMDSGGAYMRTKDDPKSDGKVNRNTLGKFFDWGWLEIVNPRDWRGSDYGITERGRKVVEKGEFRK